MRWSRTDPIPVGDKEGHVIYMGEGTAKGGKADGAKVKSREFVDITNGNGTHRFPRLKPGFLLLQFHAEQT